MLPEKFSRHNFCEILSRTIDVYRNDFHAFLGIGLMTILPSFLLTFYILISVVGDVATSLPSDDFGDVGYLQEGGGVRRFLEDASFRRVLEDSGADILTNPQSLLRKVFFGLFFYWAVLLAVQAATILATANAYLGHPLGVVNLAKDAVPRVPSMLCLGFLYFAGYIAVFLAAVIVELILTFIVLAICAVFVEPEQIVWIGLVVQIVITIANMMGLLYVSLAIMFAVPIIVVERQSAFESIKRSLELTKGHKLTLLGVTLIIACTVGAIHVSLNLLLGSSPIIMSSLLSLVMVVLSPLQTIANTVMYINARVVNEGCNSDVLGRDMSPEDADAEKRSATLAYGDVPMDDDELPIAKTIV